MMSQPFDMLAQPVRIGTLNGIEDPGVQGFSPFLGQPPVGHFVGECMLEGVLGIGKELRLVEKLARLKIGEPPPYGILAQVRHSAKQHKRYIFADHRSRLEQLLVVRREPVNPRGQDHLYSRWDFDCLDGSAQTIGASLPGKRTGFDERPDALLDKERIASPYQ